MSQGMQTDYKQEALRTVAIKFPVTERPTIFQTSYPPHTWRNIVSHAYRDRTMHAVFVTSDTPEGRSILAGTDPIDITSEFLRGLSETSLREMADRYGVKYTSKSSKTAISLKIQTAIEEGVVPKPKIENAESTSGE